MTRLVLLAHLLGRAAAMGFSTDDANPTPPLVRNHGNIFTERRSFLSSTLGSNMVLQRDVESTIWGFSDPGATINVALDDGSATLATTVGPDGAWRRTLPARPASLHPVGIHIEASTGESADLENVLFGDVYMCGGQSNMQFAVPATTNSTEEAKAAILYPHVRLFTVGQGTSSNRSLDDLQTIEQPWSVASYDSLMGKEPNIGFSYFSSVCWFFGRTIADGLDNEVPIGLISNNWGGTKVELWSPADALSACGRASPQGSLYNAMIHPYVVAPMALSGFTWYQGEANAGSQQSVDAYACLFPAMIRSWRGKFAAPDSYFGFVQLSTWCPPYPLTAAELREAQMAALDLPGNAVGYSTNADRGAGCNIHPPDKKPCGSRLGRSALALRYGKDLRWRSPSYKGVLAARVRARRLSVRLGGPIKFSAEVTVTIELSDVGGGGLNLREPFNLLNGTFDCAAQVPGTCAYASVQLGDEGWVNATASVDGARMILTAMASAPGPTVSGTAYGWGSVPMLNVYDAETDLPVLPWNRSVAVAMEADAGARTAR